MCKKQTSVSHSSTESEIISLDGELRMDGIPALDLWDSVVEVFHSSPNQPKKSKEKVQGNLLHDTPSRKHIKNQVETPIQFNDLELCNVDYVSSNMTSSQFSAMLYISEDNEAVIKMIIKGRSPTMRHVFRTHRVATDWLFDSINLDPKIQIKYVDSEHQLADILTKGISHVMSVTIFFICLISSFQLCQLPKNDGEKDATRTRRTKNVTKSKPTLNLVSKTVASSSTVLSPNGSNRLGILR